MNKFYVTGISGTGKSSLVDELRINGVRAFDLDATELCCWKNKVSYEKAEYQYGIGKDWLEAHDYICDAVEVKKLLDAQGSIPVVIAGVASNQDEYLDLFDKIFLLHCKEETFLHRLSTRDENEFAKEKSEQEYVLNWHKDFEAKMRERGAIAIDTEDTLQNVADKIMSYFSVI